MRTEHLRALLKAAQLGSISNASRALHINQQQLSKTILALENDFGCKIFERSAKGIRPTAEGEDILATAERMLSELDALTARLAQKAAQTPAAQLGGTLTIHTMVNIWPHSQLFEALDAFTSAYPAVKILYDELSPSQIIAAVVQHPEQIGSIVREQTNFGTTVSIPDAVTFLPLYWTDMKKSLVVKVLLLRLLRLLKTRVRYLLQSWLPLPEAQVLVQGNRVASLPYNLPMNSCRNFGNLLLLERRMERPKR